MAAFCASGTHVPERTLRSGSRNPPFSARPNLNLNRSMSVSPFDHPLLSALLGDEETARAFSVKAEIAAMVAVERALVEAQAAEGVIRPAAARVIGAALDSFTPDMGRLKAGTAQDGIAVPELVRQIRQGVAQQYADEVHLGATSQDIIDTALVLRLKPIVELFDGRLAEIAG